MKCIIAGSRSINDYVTLETAIAESGFDTDANITQVVSGGARGVDALGEEWAYRNHRQLIIFPADWDTYGKTAGIRRNEQMAIWADGLIALHENNSPGTRHMIACAKKRGLKVYVYEA